MKVKSIAKIIYLLSIICYITFLVTKNSMFMFFGGILLATASIVVIITNKNTNK